MHSTELISNPYRSKTYIFAYGLLLASSGLFFGYLIGNFNTFGDGFLEKIHNITNKKEREEILGNINLAFLAGGLSCALIASLIIEGLGRYRSLLLLSFGKLCVAGLFMVQSINVLYLGRFIGGFFGCFSTFIAPLMMKENLPLKYGGTISASFYIFLTGGILISYAFGNPTAIEHWRYVLGGPLIIEVPALLLYLFVFRMESPKTIVSKSDNVEANLYDNFLYIYSEEGARAETDKLVAEQREASNVEGSKVGFLDLFGPEYRLQFFLGFLLNLLNQLTGINFLVFYSKSIYEKVGLDNADTLTFFMGMMNFVGAFIVTGLGSFIGKRTSLVSGLGLQAVSYFIFLLGLTFNKGILVIIGSYLYVLSFAISLGGMLYVYLADIVPPIGLSFASLSQWLVACVVGKYAMTITNHFGEFYVFFFFMIISFVGCFIFAGYSVETQGKSDAQIKQEFMQKKFFD